MYLNIGTPLKILWQENKYTVKPLKTELTENPNPLRTNPVSSLYTEITPLNKKPLKNEQKTMIWRVFSLEGSTIFLTVLRFTVITGWYLNEILNKEVPARNLKL